jgi:hypothetical protein
MISKPDVQLLDPAPMDEVSGSIDFEDAQCVTGGLYREMPQTGIYLGNWRQRVNELIQVKRQ